MIVNNLFLAMVLIRIRMRFGVSVRSGRCVETPACLQGLRMNMVCVGKHRTWGWRTSMYASSAGKWSLLWLHIALSKFPHRISKFRFKKTAQNPNFVRYVFVFNGDWFKLIRVRNIRWWKHNHFKLSIYLTFLEYVGSP